MHCRAVSHQDLDQIEKIHAFYVETSNAAFNEPAKGSMDFKQLYDKLQSLQLPLIAAIDEATGKIAGYALVQPYHERAAYRHTVVDSIFLNKDYCGQGIGRLLLDNLIERLRDTLVRQVIAAIPAVPEDDKSDIAACRLHRSCGFVPSGRLCHVSRRFDKWIDVLFYQLDLTRNNDLQQPHGLNGDLDHRHALLHA